MRIQFDHVRMSLTFNCEVLFICVCVLIFCSHSLSVENVECEKINGCKCVMPDGIHIDLTRLNDEAKWYVS
jgi:hypothetical protein